MERTDDDRKITEIVHRAVTFLSAISQNDQCDSRLRVEAATILLEGAGMAAKKCPKCGKPMGPGHKC